MLTKFSIALLLGATAVEAVDQSYRPYRRSAPTGPTRRYTRGGSKPSRDGAPVEDKPDYELDLDFEAVPELDDNSGGRYSAQLSDALGSQYPVRDGDGTLADWNVDFDPNAPVDPTPESVDPVSDIP